MLSLQVLQWTFAAAPGHPALREICDHIARSVDQKFTGNKNFDTLERTGPGAFTDIILKHAQLHPLSKVSSAASSQDNTCIVSMVISSALGNCINPGLKSYEPCWHALGAAAEPLSSMSTLWYWA